MLNRGSGNFLFGFPITEDELVSCPDPTCTLCKGKGVWRIATLSLGQGKEFGRPNQITALSKLCDYLPQEFRGTNCNAGLGLLCSFFTAFCSDRFVLLPNTQPHIHMCTYKAKKLSIFTRPIFPCRGWGLGMRLVLLLLGMFL